MGPVVSMNAGFMGENQQETTSHGGTAGKRRSRRVKALARLSPVLDMVGAAGKGFSDIHEDVDVRALAEEAMTAVVDHMGISESYGAPRERVVERVAAAAAVMRPGNDDDALRIAEWTVDWLLNRQGGGHARKVRFADPAAGWEPATLDVTLLYEDQSPVTGDYVLRASDEAINTLLVAFNFDLADAQVAAEAVMQVHIESGNVNRASALASEAADASVGYSQRLRAVLERTRRDVTSVDWSDTVPKMLEDARKHLQARTSSERHLLANAEDMRDQQTDPQQRKAAADIVATVRRCLERHIALLNDLMPARRTFLDEQRRQQLEVVRAPRAVALASDLMIPLLGTPLKDAAGPADRFGECALGPVVPRRHGLAALVDQLLAPRRERSTEPGDGPVDLDDLEMIEVPGKFSVDEREQAAALLSAHDENARLSGLLEVAREHGVSDELMALLVSAGFAFDRQDADTHNDGTPLDDHRFGGDDLLVVPHRQEEQS
jgi:hypothetical protein